MKNIFLISIAIASYFSLLQILRCQSNDNVKLLEPENVVDADSISESEDFIQDEQGSEMDPEPRSKMEEDFAWREVLKEKERAKRAKISPEYFCNSVLEKFLDDFSNYKHADQVRFMIDSLYAIAWEKTRKIDKIDQYKFFYNNYPFSKNITFVKKRIAWQKAHAAVLDVDYPKKVNLQENAALKMVFRETSGDAGYKLKEYKVTILCKSGDVIKGSFNPNTVVKAKGKTTFKFWVPIFEKQIETKCYITWSGEDDWGNYVGCSQEIELLP